MRACQSLCLTAALFLLPGLSSAATPAYWHDVAPAAIGDTGPRLIHPLKARILALDLDALQAPLKASEPVLALPMPDGGSAEFRLHETQVMHPDLAAKYPGIRTYAGRGISDPQATLRLDIGPRGLHGMILSPRGTVYIDPLARGDTRHYQSYFKHDMPPRAGAPDQVLLPDGALRPLAPQGKAAAIGGELRTYRLAIAADGEYSQFHDPNASLLTFDKSIILAELVNVVNRVSGIYERELGIRLQLIAENDRLIFTSPLVDPYLDSQGIQMLLINTAVLNALVGPGAYDIGHVVSTGGGGVAGLGVVCGAQKGSGVTGLPNPVGDPFYVDYVAHEMGHQFGANHTFNSDAGACAGGNRNAGTAYEPGSASSIMGYAGICGEHDLQPNSDDYFHSVSFDEIIAFTQGGAGDACAALTPSANRAPSAEAGPGYTIPKLTPFELAGAGNDPDGDPVTYQWEQFDLGPAGSPDEPVGNAPLFRSFPPTPSPVRVFPQLSDLLNNQHTLGEILPAEARALTFRFIVRDNRFAPDGGGVASDTTELQVAGNAGPFRITAPNGPADYDGSGNVKLQWDVAGTDQPPVSCATVDVYYSKDGGRSFPELLLASTANDGEETVKIPGAEGARLKLKCSGNVFFDVSDADLKTTSKSMSANAGRFGGALAPALLLVLFGALSARRARSRSAAG